MIENIFAIVNADVCERTGAKQAKCRAKMRVTCATNQTRHLERCKFLCEHSNTRMFFSVNVLLCVPNCCCRNLHVKHFLHLGVFINHKKLSFCGLINLC
jgi:hypothetical protein